MSKCFECGATKNLHHHHIIPRSQGGTKTIPLCTRCHGYVHDADLSKATELSKQKHKEKHERFERVGNIPYGYQVGKDKVTLIPNPKEQEILAYIITLRKLGLSYKDICLKMKERNFRNRKRKHFDKRSVHFLLNGRASTKLKSP